MAAAPLSGGYHSVALDKEGGAWSWGRGEWGRLGHGDSSDCYEPTKIEGGGETHSVALPKLSAAFAADAHSGCLTVSGEVYTWGRNENWQLGYEVSHARGHLPRTWAHIAPMSRTARAARAASFPQHHSHARASLPPRLRSLHRSPPHHRSPQSFQLGIVPALYVGSRCRSSGC